MATTAKDVQPAQRLLERAHSPTTAARIFNEKIKSKPLLLTPTKATPRDKADARAQRTARREAAAASRRRKSKKKPAPLSAKQRRALCVHDLDKSELKFDIYAGLHKLWCGYMRSVLSLPKEGLDVDDAKRIHMTPERSGPLLSSADMHGAKMRVVRSRCPGRVGTEGIAVRETRFTFVIVTPKNQGKTVPKEGTVFRYEVPLLKEGVEGDVKPLGFEVHGDAIMFKPADRSGRKFKQHVSKGL